MKIRVAVVLAAALAAMALTAYAQEFWVKKEYKSWSENDCKKMLENSPWAKDWGDAKVHQDVFGQATGERARETETRLKYIAQIRSAMPLRQAMVRQMMFDAKYDKMSPEQKQALDQRAEQFLSAEFPDTIVIVVRYSVSVPGWEQELANHWQSVPPESVPVGVDLIGPRGERVQPMRYVVARGSGREFQFVFPRLVNGEPIIKPGDKSFKLEFPHPNVGREQETGRFAFPSGRAFFEFKVDKMVIGDKVAY